MGSKACTDVSYAEIVSLLKQEKDSGEGEVHLSLRRKVNVVESSPLMSAGEAAAAAAAAAKANAAYEASMAAAAPAPSRRSAGSTPQQRTPRANDPSDPLQSTLGRPSSMATSGAASSFLPDDLEDDAGPAGGNDDGDEEDGPSSSGAFLPEESMAQVSISGGSAAPDEKNSFQSLVGGLGVEAEIDMFGSMEVSGFAGKQRAAVKGKTAAEEEDALFGPTPSADSMPERRTRQKQGGKVALPNYAQHDRQAKAGELDETEPLAVAKRAAAMYSKDELLDLVLLEGPTAFCSREELLKVVLMETAVHPNKSPGDLLGLVLMHRMERDQAVEEAEEVQDVLKAQLREMQERVKHLEDLCKNGAGVAPLKSDSPPEMDDGLLGNYGCDVLQETFYFAFLHIGELDENRQLGLTFVRLGDLPFTYVHAIKEDGAADNWNQRQELLRARPKFALKRDVFGAAVEDDEDDWTIRPGDRIEAINGLNVRGWSYKAIIAEVKHAMSLPVDRLELHLARPRVQPEDVLRRVERGHTRSMHACRSYAQKASLLYTAIMISPPTVVLAVVLFLQMTLSAEEFLTVVIRRDVGAWDRTPDWVLELLVAHHEKQQEPSSVLPKLYEALSRYHDAGAYLTRVAFMQTRPAARLEALQDAMRLYRLHAQQAEAKAAATARARAAEEAGKGGAGDDLTFFGRKINIGNFGEKKTAKETATARMEKENAAFDFEMQHITQAITLIQNQMGIQEHNEDAEWMDLEDVAAERRKKKRPPVHGLSLADTVHYCVAHSIPASVSAFGHGEKVRARFQLSTNRYDVLDFLAHVRSGHWEAVKYMVSPPVSGGTWKERLLAASKLGTFNPLGIGYGSVLASLQQYKAPRDVMEDVVGLVADLNDRFKLCREYDMLEKAVQTAEEMVEPELLVELSEVCAHSIELRGTDRGNRLLLAISDAMRSGAILRKERERMEEQEKREKIRLAKGGGW